MNWKKRGGKETLILRETNGVCYLAFPALEETNGVIHAFSTRIGGVSEGVYASMNFSFSRGDRADAVRENYRRMAQVLGVDAEKMVLSHQTHTTHVRRVTSADAGKGIWRERDYQDVDGLITNVSGMTLVTFYADCVPLYLYDPEHHAIGLSHSGWRGTVHRMGEVTLREMKLAYGTRPESVIACIGPSICRDCFEVGAEVIEEFAKGFASCHHDALFAKKDNGKYQLDLWKANQLVFLEAGVPEHQIHTTNICTKCNPDYLFSHRAMGDKRGNLAAFLTLR